MIGHIPVETGLSYQAAVFLILIMVGAALGGLWWLLEYLKKKQEREIDEDG